MRINNNHKINNRLNLFRQKIGYDIEKSSWTLSTHGSYKLFLDFSSINASPINELQMDQAIAVEIAYALRQTPYKKKKYKYTHAVFCGDYFDKTELKLTNLVNYIVFETMKFDLEKYFYILQESLLNYRPNIKPSTCKHFELTLLKTNFNFYKQYLTRLQEEEEEIIGKILYLTVLIWEDLESQPSNWFPITPLTNTPWVYSFWFRCDNPYMAFSINKTYKNCPLLYNFYAEGISILIIRALQKFPLFKENYNINLIDSIYNVEIKCSIHKNDLNISEMFVLSIKDTYDGINSVDNSNIKLVIMNALKLFFLKNTSVSILAPDCFCFIFHLYIRKEEK